MTSVLTRYASQYFTSIPFSSIFDGFSGSHDLLVHPPGQSTIPLPLRAGDYNVDGYPDLLLTISNTTAAPGGGPFGGRRGGTQVRVLENVPCKSGVAGCDTGTAKRGLRVGSGKGWEVLDEIWDAQGASWLDLDDDVSVVGALWRVSYSGRALTLCSAWCAKALTRVGVARYHGSEIGRSGRSKSYIRPKQLLPRRIFPQSARWVAPRFPPPRSVVIVAEYRQC